MFWKQASKKAALCGLVVGEALVFYLMLNQMDPLPVLGGHFNAGFIALAANFVVFVLVSAVTKKRQDAVSLIFCILLAVSLEGHLCGKNMIFLGTMNVPDDVYYGVQTMRAVKNFHITGERLDPDFIKALATVKKAAALANMETGRLNAISREGAYARSR